MKSYVGLPEKRARGRVMGAIASIVTMCLIFSMVDSGRKSADASTPAPPGSAAPTAYAVKGVGIAEPKVPAPKPSMTIAGKSAGVYKPEGTALPAAATGEATFAAAPAPAGAGAAAPASPKTPISGTPLWAQRISASSGPTGVSAAVQSTATAEALGVDGVVFALSPSSSAGQVRVGLDYSAFKDAYGGNFGSRLELYTLPACALTTPKLARCRVRTPVSGQTNDTAAEALSGVVDLAGVSSTVSSAVLADGGGTQATVLAASSGPGEEGAATGSYGASPISPDGTWSAGNSAGDFTYDYAITDPSSSSPLAPEVALDYDSGSVDGKTSLTNAQSSWVGDGWAAPSDDYITQDFVPCDDAPEGTASPTSTLDMCYDGEILTMDLNGASTTIVDDGGTFRLQGDNGAQITHITSSGKGQGTYNTDYWVITERDGTSYYFGLNQLPGYTSGKTTTDSVDWEPVYSSHSTDPCYNSTWADSVCTMAYKWHLDYVTDAHSDAMAYYYTQATNYYGENNGAANAEYIRDSYLKEIDYGFTTSTGPYGLIPDEILFNGQTRCVSGTCATLSSSMSTSTAASEYPDIPVDLLCTTGPTCPIDAPSFFSTELLGSISTRQYSPSTSAYVAVDSYALTQDFPSTGDSSSGTLWLEYIQHNGADTTAGGSTSAIGEPNVTFSGTDLPDRWDTATYPGLYRWRVDEVVSELGSKTSVTYSIPDTCAANTSTEPSATPSSNTTSCYPVYWTPPTYSAPIEDWFIKYAVTEVTVQDQTGGNEEQYTQFSYANPAWHYDDDPAVKAADRTYGEFRGYQKVTTLTGNGTGEAQDKSVALYYQGMYGDYLTPTTTSTTTVADSFGNTHPDYNALVGDELEQDVYWGDSTTLDSSTINDYWVSSPTASQTVPGLPTVTAQMADVAETFVQKMTTDGGTTGWDYSETDNSYDTTTTDSDFGLLLDVYSHAWTSSHTSGTDVDDSDTTYAHCTTYNYAPVNTAENLVGLISLMREVSAPCSGFTEGSPAWVPSGTFALSGPSFTQAQLIFASADFYDQGGSFTTTFAPQTTAPTTGNLTETALAIGYSGGTFTYQMDSETTYDAYGRPLDVYDPDGNETVTGYTVTDGLTTAESVQNALSQDTSETFDPTRALTLTSTDANGIVTTRQYDALGRITAEWDDSRYSATTSVQPNYVYSYTESDSGLSGSETQTMDDENGDALLVTVLDSLGRTRQTQSSTPDGGMLVTDTAYNSLGQVSQVDDAWWDSTGTPAISLATTTSQAAIPNWDKYTYNGLGDRVEDQSMTLSDAVYDTTYTVDAGDKVTTIPNTTSISPITGGKIQTVGVDPLGRQDTTTVYSAGAAQPTLTVPANLNTGVLYISGGTALTTTYGYDGQGNQATTTDPDGDSWTDTYNALGEVAEKADPTSGDLTNMEYDPDGNLEQSEDSRGDYLSYTYDKLGRETGQYASTFAAQSTGVSGNQMYAWIYDNSNNAVTGMTDPIGQLTTQIVDAGGQSYSLQYKGFNKFGESTGETYTIGSGAGDLAGTYKYLHYYSSNTGLPAYTQYYSEASGALPAETVTTGYSSTGGIDEPDTVSSALGSYATNASYDGYSRISDLQIGTGSNKSWKNDTYDVHTGSLLQQAVTNSSTTNDNVDDVSYTYDTSGNITAETDERTGSTSDEETQCFDYNSLEQLSTAYSSTSGCGTAPTSSSYAMVGNGLGNGSAYWESWIYDNEGDRTSQDIHSLTNPADDTDTAYTYNTGTGSQAHTLASTSTTVNGTHTASTSYGYDAAGNVTTRTTAADGTQTIGWDNAGQLTSVSSTTKGTSSYIYNPEGGLLVQKDGTTTTLYLENEQLTYNSSTSLYSGDRYYDLPGGGTAVRTGSGNSYDFEFPDQHSTNDLTLDFTAQDAAWRQFDPYGNPRGTATAWIDNRGFLNDPDDTATGLTDVSARWYDPTIGDFVSLDSLLEVGDVLALGGYGYTDEDPVSEVDETGQSAGDVIGYISDWIGIGGLFVTGGHVFWNGHKKRIEARKPPAPDPLEPVNEKLNQVLANQTEAAELKSQVQDLTAENAGLTAEKSDLEGLVGDLQSQLGSATSENDNLQGQLGEATAENSSLRGQLGSATAENADLQDQVQNLSSQLEQANTQAAQDLATARSEAAAYRAAAEREAELRAAAEKAKEEAEKNAKGDGDEGDGGNGSGSSRGTGGNGSGTTSSDGSAESGSRVAATDEDGAEVEQSEAQSEESAEEAQDQDAGGWDPSAAGAGGSDEEEDDGAGGGDGGGNDSGGGGVGDVATGIYDPDFAAGGGG